MNIYFGGALRASSDDWHTYGQLIAHLKSHGTVLTEHFDRGAYSLSHEQEKNDHDLFHNYMDLLVQCTVMVCEVTTPSLGVGYEIAKATQLEKPVLCLYRPQQGKRLSALVAGNQHLVIKEYRSLGEAFEHIDAFIARAGDNNK